MTKIYQLKTRPNKEALGVETYLAPPPPLQGKIIGLDCHPDTFTAAVFVGQTPHEARKVGGRENLGLQALLGWAAKEFGAQDLFVLEAGSNSFELCTRLHALGLRAVVLRRELPRWQARQDLRRQRQNGCRAHRAGLSGRQCSLCVGARRAQSSAA